MTYANIWRTFTNVQINPAALKAIRESGGYSQLSLATASKVNQGHISKMESAAGPVNVRPDTVKKLATALNVPMAAITVPQVAAAC